MAFVGAANLAGQDPLDLEPIEKSSSRNAMPHGEYVHRHHKPTLSEYIYWARLKRQAEKNGTSGNGVDGNGVLMGRASLKDYIKYRGRPPQSVKQVESAHHNGDLEKDIKNPVSINVVDLPRAEEDQGIGMTEEEHENMVRRRQMRVAGWLMMFYLITTDILGPFNAPYAIANMGLVTGILCYVFFGIIASLTGFMIGHLFLKLDSDRYPIRTYGDLCQRLIGKWFRIFASFLQSVQLVVNVGLICLSSGQSLYQVANRNICFSVAVVIWAIVGMIAGQIRSLRNFAIIGQSSVYINLLIIFMSMGVVAHTPPNYTVANNANDTLGYGPVVVVAFQTGSLVNQINGIFNMVFAYGGAMIFPEMVSEMRRPAEFWKGMACADSLIGCCYLFYGVFWYCFQGQYTQPNSFQGLAPYSWQTVCNVLNMITGMIAACLYGNIGVKVLYVNIVQDFFRGPVLNSRKGRWLWTFFIPLYWSIAFVIANSIPALGAMTGLIGAVCIFQFSYTFPPLLWLVYNLRKDAAVDDKPYSGFGTEPVPIDTWRHWARWSRAWFGTGRNGDESESSFSSQSGFGRFMLKMSQSKMVMFLVKLFMLGLFLACLACLALGCYGTGEAIKETFEVGQATAFGCNGNA